MHYDHAGALLKLSRQDNAINHYQAKVISKLIDGVDKIHLE